MDLTISEIYQKIKRDMFRGETDFDFRYRGRAWRLMKMDAPVCWCVRPLMKHKSEITRYALPTRYRGFVGPTPKKALDVFFGSRKIRNTFRRRNKMSI